MSLGEFLTKQFFQCCFANYTKSLVLLYKELCFFLKKRTEGSFMNITIYHFLKDTYRTELDFTLK